MPVTPVSARAAQVIDEQNRTFLDFYGGHAVISIGHSHPKFNQALVSQLDRIAFYSNSVQMPIQHELAQRLGEASGYTDYQFFMCNSGAEAVENALKLASFHTGRSEVIAFSGSFHGRTSAAVAITDNPSIVAPLNANHHVKWLPFNDIEALQGQITNQTAAVIVEGIQGVAGVCVPTDAFLLALQDECRKYGVQLIIDEIQSGCGRTGRYFAHQWTEGLQPDLITVAKGIGNGFPVGGVLIAPHLKPKAGMLGTTFGGNYLACTAMLTVLKVMHSDNLMANALEQGQYLAQQLALLQGVERVTGRGLMLGLVLQKPAAEIRQQLLCKHHIFTGNASDPRVIRLLPPLCVSRSEVEAVVSAFQEVFQTQQTHETVS